MKEIQELLSQFKYPQLSEKDLKLLYLYLNPQLTLDLPKDHYAIKRYANFIRSKITSISLKKSHAIELVSRIIFNNQWHKLSKQIPKLTSLNYNNRFIEYGCIPFRLDEIEEYKKLGITLLIINKKKDKLLTLIHPDNDLLYEFIKSNSFENIEVFDKKLFHPLNNEDAMKILKKHPDFLRYSQAYLINESQEMSIKDLIDHQIFDNDMIQSSKDSLIELYEINKDRAMWDKVNEIIFSIQNKQNKLDQLIVSQNKYTLFNYEKEFLLALHILGIKTVTVRVVGSKFQINPKVRVKMKLKENIDNILKEDLNSDQKSLKLIQLAELSFSNGDMNAYEYVNNKLLAINPSLVQKIKNQSFLTKERIKSTDCLPDIDYDKKKYYIVATEDEKEKIVDLFKESFNKKEGIVYYDNFQEALNFYVKNRNKTIYLFNDLKLVIFELLVNSDLTDIAMTIKEYR